MLDLLLMRYTSGAGSMVVALGHRVGDGLAGGSQDRGAVISPGAAARAGVVTPGSATRGAAVTPGSGKRSGPIGGGGQRSW